MRREKGAVFAVVAVAPRRGTQFASSSVGIVVGVPGHVAQLFGRGTVLALRLALLLLLVLISGVVLMWRWFTSDAYAQGAPVPQPLPFSHKHHVDEDGIDCRYCHHSVERSAFAGIPASQVCMNCHSQLFAEAPLLAPLRKSYAEGTRIEWTRVHDLPAFVYFDHRAHVGHGVACTACHGAVQRMPVVSRVHSLRMQWCLQCHRSVANRPDLTDCSTCHR
jgi:hypothetical protein